MKINKKRKDGCVLMDDSRTLISKTGKEYARSARSNWQLWKLCEELIPEEIEVLISKRKSDLRHEKDFEKREEIRNDIMILEDAVRIISHRSDERK